jgi:hypothetical protein
VALRTSGNVRPFDFLATDKFTRIWYLFPEAPRPTDGLTR